MIEPTILEPKTIYVSLALLVSVVGTMMLAAWKISATLSQINNRLSNIESAFRSTVTENEFAQWLLELKNSNPSLVVPAIKPKATHKE